MSGITIELKNNHTREFLEAMRSQAILGLEAIGEAAEGYAKDDCPVDTGRLRNSIAHAADENEVVVGTNVEYAEFVEFRDVEHRTGKAHFLRDSVANHQEEYKAILEAALKA